MDINHEVVAFSMQIAIAFGSTGTGQSQSVKPGSQRKNEACLKIRSIRLVLMFACLAIKVKKLKIRFLGNLGQPYPFCFLPLMFAF
jgi:hypothetical protein